MRVKQFIKADRNKVRAGQAPSKHPPLLKHLMLGLWDKGDEGLVATSDLASLLAVR